MIEITFVCGHTMQADGNEEHPRCACGEDRRRSVKARAPRFKGYACGPCATFVRLKAKPIELRSKR